MGEKRGHHLQHHSLKHQTPCDLIESRPCGESRVVPAAAPPPGAVTGVPPALTHRYHSSGTNNTDSVGTLGYGCSAEPFAALIRGPLHKIGERGYPTGGGLERLGPAQ